MDVRNLIGKIHEYLDLGDRRAAIVEFQQIRRLNLSYISAHSELAAAVHQRGETFTPKLKELAEDAIETYQDIEELVKDLVELFEAGAQPEICEVLDELEECLLELVDLRQELQPLLETEDGVRFKVDEEFYLE